MDLADTSQKDKDSLKCSASGDQHSISASTGTKDDLTKKLLLDAESLNLPSLVSIIYTYIQFIFSPWG